MANCDCVCPAEDADSEETGSKRFSCGKQLLAWDVAYLNCYNSESRATIRKMIWSQSPEAGRNESTTGIDENEYTNVARRSW